MRRESPTEAYRAGNGYPGRSAGTAARLVALSPTGSVLFHGEMRAPRITLVAVAVAVALVGNSASSRPHGPLDDILANHDIGHGNVYFDHTFPSTPGTPCDKGSLPEPGLRGRVPLADFTSGRAAKGYTCNARVVAR